MSLPIVLTRQGLKCDHEAGSRGGRHVACLVVSSMRIAKKSELGVYAQLKFTYIVNLSVELCYAVAVSHF